MWSPPRQFDEYVVHRLLGRGQMGHVHLGHDTLLDRDVAIKFISAPMPSESVRRRFLIEARAAARIQHPNVVAIYRVGELDERAFLVSEFIRGRSLDQVQKPMAWSDALKIGIDLVRGLAAAHRKGVLHRDLKPANAIVTEDGDAKLLDFGLAKLTEETALPMESGEACAETADFPVDDRAAAAATIAPDDHPASTDGGRGRALTRVGALMGTPDYMSPEAWRGEQATRATDIYSIGALLYELCAGRPPHGDVAPAQLASVVQARDPLPVARVVPSIDPKLALLIDRCLRRDPAERFSSADDLRDALEGLWRKNRGASIPEGNPYRGLRPFEAAQRALFFGRDTDINAILDRLRSDSFVLVSGDSGIGKSSICRAGVLPALIEENLENRGWSYVTLTPGRHPAKSLATSLASLASLREEEAQVLLAEDVGELLSRLRKRLGSRSGLVIFVDQFEELVTQSDPAELAIVEHLILRIASGLPGIRLLATARADFLTRLVSLPALGEEVSRSIHMLPPIAGSRIRQVIVGPAEATDTQFESEELVDTLASSMDGAPGGLPLLQFALAELWEAREANRITSTALMRIGGVEGALARHADEVIDRLRPRERDAAERILVRLVTREGVRAKRTERELIGEDTPLRETLDALVRGRLLVVEETPEGSAFALAHDVLISGWSRLRSWIEEDADARVARERLASAAAEWTRLGRGVEGLWSRRQLEEISKLELGDHDEATRSFLLRSRAQMGRRARARWGIAVAIPLALGLAYGVAWLESHWEESARVEKHLSTARQHFERGRIADEQARERRSEAFESFAQLKRDQAEPIWADSLAKSSDANNAYVDSIRTLDTALEIDRENEQLADELKQVLFARALLLERDRRKDVLAEVLDRFHLHDSDGELMKRWRAPAIIDLSKVPAGITSLLERYVASGDRLSLVPVTIGSALVEVDPGSYRLTLEGSGLARVVLPLLASRGETVVVDPALPDASKIPPHLVFVPGGRFIFGSSADEESRLGFYDAEPAHQLELEPFLIGQREITFEDWIQYLNTLPPEERRERTPGLDGSLLGAVALEERSPREWVLTIRPGSAVYQAREGEPIRYRARDRRIAQNWLRFPVLGISANDVEAYAAWLDKSGALPGARLCTEQEWEKAARGADGREFPHGDRLALDDANFDQTYDKDPGAMGPDEVGSHPASRSPFGVDDMAGNAFEWTVAAPHSTTYVLKGGSYFYDSKTNRLSNRAVSVGTLRASSVGARLCATLEKSFAVR